jgi:hypothetical protein
MSKRWKIAYISTIADHSESSFADILAQSRSNNRRAGITGVLLRDSHSYFQYLEGQIETLGACMLRIAGDGRHSRVTQLLSVPTDTVLFDGWALAEAQLPKRRQSLAAFAKLLEESSVVERIGLVEKVCMDAFGA